MKGLMDCPYFWYCFQVSVPHLRQHMKSMSKLLFFVFNILVFMSKIGSYPCNGILLTSFFTLPFSYKSHSLHQYICPKHCSPWQLYPALASELLTRHTSGNCKVPYLKSLSEMYRFPCVIIRDSSNPSFRANLQQLISTVFSH